MPSSVGLHPDSFDFDGDGSPELFLPSTRFDGDGDGRPDLVLDYDGTLNDEGTHSSMSSQNWKLAHSLRDGSFSTKDSVAQHYAVSP